MRKKKHVRIPKVDPLEACRRAYEVGNLAAVLLALRICESQNAPLPSWLTEAAVTLARQERTGWASVYKRLNFYLVHMRRGEVLWNAKHVEKIGADSTSQRSWAEALNAAANILESEPAGAGVDLEAISKSYQRALKLSRDPKKRDFVRPFYPAVDLMAELMLLTARDQE